MDLIDMGPIVKMYRIKNGFTQEDLSEGICTPSYLSRIENSHVIADVEIYQLLFQRMNIKFNEFYEESLNIERELEEIYIHLLGNKEPFDNKDFKLLTDPAKYFFKKDLHIKAKLVFIRYLITSKRYKEAELLINEIEEVLQLAADRNTFIYINVAIPLYYLLNKQREAILLFHEATKIRDLLSNGTPFEVACYYYNVALLFCKEYKYVEAIEYCQKAFNKFSDIYKPSLDFKCHILLGVAKNNLAQYNLAKHHYKVCLNILRNTEKMRSPKNFNMIYSNLGYCYECDGNFKQALDCYTKVLEYDPQVVDYLSIIRCHYQNNNIDSAIKYLNNILEMDTIIEIKYQYQIDILAFILLGKMNVKTADDIESLEEKSLNYFKANQYHTLTIFYSKLFAQFYKKINWYKKSSKLFELALDVSEILRKGGQVE